MSIIAALDRLEQALADAHIRGECPSGADLLIAITGSDTREALHADIVSVLHEHSRETFNCSRHSATWAGATGCPRPPGPVAGRAVSVARRSRHRRSMVGRLADVGS